MFGRIAKYENFNYIFNLLFGCVFFIFNFEYSDILTTSFYMSLETKDFQILVCPKCNQTKKRIRVGKRPNSKETKFIGEDGLEFSGRVCGTCHRNKVKQTKQLNTALIRQAKALGKSN